MAFERSLPLGSISAKQQKKFNLVAKRTTVQPARMAGQQDDDMDADDRLGLRDQGGVRDRGDRTVAGARSIDTKQRKGSQIASAPTRGGAAGKEHQPVHRRSIDEHQKPEWPAGGSKVKRGAKGTPSRLKGPTGPMQKGGAQSPYYGASGGRP